MRSLKTVRFPFPLYRRETGNEGKRNWKRGGNETAIYLRTHGNEQETRNGNEGHDFDPLRFHQMHLIFDTREPAKSYVFQAQKASRQPIIFRMSADPVPKKSAFHEFPHRPVVFPHAGRPVFPANFFEVKRWVKWFRLPQVIIFAGHGADGLGQIVVGFPKLRATRTGEAHASSLSNMRSSGSQRPALKAASARTFMASNFPAAKSAFICLSHSSSGKGFSSAINSQYSRGESWAMASLISATLMPKRYRTDQHIARRGKCRCT